MMQFVFFPCLCFTFKVRGDVNEYKNPIWSSVNGASVVLLHISCSWVVCSSWKPSLEYILTSKSKVKSDFTQICLWLIFKLAGIAQSVKWLGYELDDWGSVPDRGREWFILFTTASTPALWPTQPSVQWVPGAPSLRVKRLRREAYHSPTSNAEAKNAWSYTFTPSTSSLGRAWLSKRHFFMACYLANRMYNFTFAFWYINMKRLSDPVASARTVPELLRICYLLSWRGYRTKQGVSKSIRIDRLEREL
jgi:hypothetical protein